MNTPHPPSTLSRCVRAAPNSSAGIVLFRLVWWTKNTKFRREGVHWACPSNERLADETGLSVRQVRRAIEQLTDAKLIERRREQRKWKAIYWTRVPAAGQHEVPEFGHPEAPEFGHLVKDQELEDQELEEEATEAVAPLSEKFENSLEEEKTPHCAAPPAEDAMKEKPASVADVMHARAFKKANLEDPQSLDEAVEAAMKNADIVEVFRRAWMVAKIPGPIRTPTAKERGQLTHLTNWLFSEPEAEGTTTARLIADCVSKWPLFRVHVANATGWDVKKVSPTPDFGLLLYRKEHALAFSKKLRETPEAEKSTMKTVSDFLDD